MLIDLRAIRPCRTYKALANNVGDLVGTTVVSKQMGLLNEEIYNSDN